MMRDVQNDDDGKPTLLVLASTYPRWSGDPEPGFVHELSKRLVRQFRVIVLCPHAPGAFQRGMLDGVHVVRYRYAPENLEVLVNDGGIVANLRLSKWKLLLVPGFVLAQAWYAWRLSQEKKVDVIHAHWLLPQGLIAALLQMLPGREVPFVVTSHGADLYALRGGLMDALKRFVLRRARAATVVSTAMLDELRATDADISKVSVQPMGVDMRGRFCRDLAVTRSHREILFVGRLVEKKGLHHLLNAMPEVLRQMPDVRLVIAGFGPEADALKAQTDMLGLAPSVQFIGAVAQADLPALYQRAALFVAPFVRATSGDQEGLGLVLVEAIGCGCPILVGNVPAVAEVLGAEFAGMTVDPTDVAALSSRIVDMLVRPDATRAQATLLREVVGGRFDWNEVAKRYSQVLVTASEHAVGKGRLECE